MHYPYVVSTATHIPIIFKRELSRFSLFEYHANILHRFSITSEWTRHFFQILTVIQISCHSLWKYPPFLPFNSYSTVKLCGLRHIFPSFSKWSCPTFLCVDVIQTSCIVSRFTSEWTLLFFHFFFCHTYSGLNTSTGHWTMSDKISSYTRWKLLHNGHSCPAWS